MPIGEAREALLLTPKARIVAPLVAWRRGAEDYLLVTEPESGERLARELVRGRFAAKCTIELEEHRSTVVLGEPALAAYGTNGLRDGRLRRPGRRARGRQAPTRRARRARRARAAADPRAHAPAGPGARRSRDARRGGPRGAGDKLHEGLLPRAGAGRAAPLPRPANRGLRLLAIEDGERPPPTPNSSSTARSWVASRVPRRTQSAASSPSPTSAVRCPRTRSSSWGAAASASWAGTSDGLPVHCRFPAPVAQGIERCPAEAEVARSNRAGRIKDSCRWGLLPGRVASPPRAPGDEWRRVRLRPAAGAARERATVSLLERGRPERCSGRSGRIARACLGEGRIGFFTGWARCDDPSTGGRGSTPTCGNRRSPVHTGSTAGSYGCGRSVVRADYRWLASVTRSSRPKGLLSRSWNDWYTASINSANDR